MLVWGLIFALPVAVLLLAVVGGCYLLVRHPLVLWAGVTGTGCTYLGTYFFFLIAPPHLARWLHQHPTGKALLQLLGLHFGPQPFAWLLAEVGVLTRLFGLGALVGSGLYAVTRLAKVEG